jgi:hypothetical protein
VHPGDYGGVAGDQAAVIELSLLIGGVIGCWLLAHAIADEARESYEDQE